MTNASVEISRAFLANPHVDVLTEKFGTTCVAGMKNAVLGMDDRTVELQQQFNALVSRYQQIYGGALVELDGKQLTIPQLGPTRRIWTLPCAAAAYEAEAGYFDAHRAELDELYAEIVKNLNAQAQVMGYHDYSELSYVRMNRIGYGPEDIKRHSATRWPTTSCRSCRRSSLSRTSAPASSTPLLPTCRWLSRTATPSPSRATTPGCRRPHHVP